MTSVKWHTEGRTECGKRDDDGVDACAVQRYETTGWAATQPYGITTAETNAPHIVGSRAIKVRLSLTSEKTARIFQVNGLSASRVVHFHTKSAKIPCTSGRSSPKNSRSRVSCVGRGLGWHPSQRVVQRFPFSMAFQAAALFSL